MANDFVQPTDLPVRSPIYRALLVAGARFRAVGNGAIVADYGRGDEAGRLKNLGLVDLSPLPRIGFKGTGTIAWARSRELSVPQRNNRSRTQGDGSLVVRLTDGEILVLGNPKQPGEVCAALERTCLTDAPENCYPVPRGASHAWLLVGGRHAGAMFAKLCALDLCTGKFPDGHAAQVIVARIGAIVVRDDIGGVPAFHLLADCASTDYLWRCLKDAAREFNGEAVGYDALAALL